MTAYWFHGSSKLQSPNRCTSQQWCEIEISIGRNDNNIWSKDSCSHRMFLESQKTHTHTHHIALCQSPEVTHNHPIRNQVLLHAVFGWRPLSSSCVQHHARCLRFVRTGYSDLSSFVWGLNISTSTWWKTFPSARLISERPTNDSLQVYLCTVYDVIVPRSGDWNLLGVKKYWPRVVSWLESSISESSKLPWGRQSILN